MGKSRDLIKCLCQSPVTREATNRRGQLRRQQALQLVDATHGTAERDLSLVTLIDSEPPGAFWIWRVRLNVTWGYQSSCFSSACRKLDIMSWSLPAHVSLHSSAGQCNTRHILPCPRPKRTPRSHTINALLNIYQASHSHWMTSQCKQSTRHAWHAWGKTNIGLHACPLVCFVSWANYSIGTPHMWLSFQINSYFLRIFDQHLSDGDADGHGESKIECAESSSGQPRFEIGDFLEVVPWKVESAINRAVT